MAVWLSSTSLFNFDFTSSAIACSVHVKFGHNRAGGYPIFVFFNSVNGAKF
jgi:hypothetical protein